jgi:hypothetical protein
MTGSSDRLAQIETLLLDVAACKHKRSDLQTREFSAQIICN